MTGTGKPKGARGNREGKPWRRADGRWTARVWPPEETIDRRPRYVYGKTLKEVKANRDELAGKLSRGLPQDPDQTVGEFFGRWLNETLQQYVDAGNMAESTLDSYRDNAEKHIVPDSLDVPTLRHIKLADLTAPMVREWQRRLSQKPSGRPRRKLRKDETELPPPATLLPRTVGYCRGILHKAIEDARRDEAAGLHRNVVDLVDPPGKRQGKSRPKKTKPTLTPQQASALLIAMSQDRLWCYWFIAFALGFRRGEGLGMRWPDLDLVKRIWTPRLSVQRLRGERDPVTGRRKGKLVAKELKTEASTAPIAIPVSAADALICWQQEQDDLRLSAPRWADLGLVFTTRFGTALEPRNVDRAWEALCVRAGVPGVRLHDLRHACASSLPVSPPVST